ncbi:MAG: ABC transporter substrate-binding protein [Acetobacteraceae bacterium]|nr:ABC transporter substrate-binding protein [Acetobacteraceae bacterium]
MQTWATVWPGAIILLGLVAGQALAAPPVRDGQFTVCVDPSYPPMEFYRAPGDRDPVGFDIDVAADLAKEWGAKPRIVATDFPGLLPALAAGRCDAVISGMFVTPARAAQFPAVPYLRSSQVLLVRAGTTGIAGPDDLAGKTVAVQAGTEYEKRAHALDEKLRAEGKPGLTVQAYPKGSDVAEQLLTGRAQVGITQDTEAAYRAEVQPGKFAVAYTYPATDTFGIYLPKGADKEAVQEAVNKLRSDGTLGKLVAAWHMPAAGAQAP